MNARWKNYRPDNRNRTRKPIKETKVYKYRPPYRTTHHQQVGDPMEIGNVEKKLQQKTYTEQ